MTLNTFLVEDNPLIRDTLIPTLEDLANARVVGIAEGEEAAIKWLDAEDGHWDLAVVDLFLKDGSGLGVLAACRGRAAHQRVVLLTNYATSTIREQAMGLGADAVFDKSMELEGLLDFCTMVESGGAQR